MCIWFSAPESQALLSESDRNDGILLMGVAFGLIVLTAVVAMLIYVCWKQTHEYVQKILVVDKF